MQSAGIKGLATAVVSMVAATFPVYAQVELPEPVYQISMSASYESDNHQVQGRQRIRWRNTSSVPIDELQFHLYLNAFANDRSTFMVGSGGQLRGVKIPKEGWGWIEVDSMRLAYGTDLIAAGVVGEEEGSDPFRKPFGPTVPGEPEPVDLDDRPDLKQVEEFIRPDDGNEEDRTVRCLPVPACTATSSSVASGFRRSASSRTQATVAVPRPVGTPTSSTPTASSTRISETGTFAFSCP
jgi:hypothetical protein